MAKKNTTIMSEAQAATQYEAPLHSMSEFASWKQLSMDTAVRRELDEQLANDPTLRDEAQAAADHDILRWAAWLVLKRRARKPESVRAVEAEQRKQEAATARARLFKMNVDSIAAATDFFKATDLGRIGTAQNGLVYFHYVPGPTAMVLLRCEDTLARRFSEIHQLPPTVRWTAGGWANWLLSARAGIAVGRRVEVYGTASPSARALFDADTLVVKDTVLQPNGALPAAPAELGRLLAIVGGASGDVDQALLHGL